MAKAVVYPGSVHRGCHTVLFGSTLAPRWSYQDHFAASVHELGPVTTAERDAWKNSVEGVEMVQRRSSVP
jgi:hypothetical protein